MVTEATSSVLATISKAQLPVVGNQIFAVGSETEVVGGDCGG